ncbi:MAG: hypothetical protein ABIR70_05225 [Bryobacteraceae bacterium]
MVATYFYLGVLVAVTAAGQTLTTTQGLSINLSPLAKIVSTPVTVALVSPGGAFTTFSGSGTVNLRIRTAPASSGSLQVRITSDFSPAGGPSAGSGDLTYTCTTGYGSACSGPIVAQTATQTSVATYSASACTGGGGTCSAANPTSATITLTIADRPAYQTNTYNATITYSISIL